MKIGLHMPGVEGESDQTVENRVLANLILSAKQGDWEARNALTQKFIPLLTSLAEKRSEDPVAINKYIEVGKQGVLAATKKYKPSIGPEKFRIFAVDFIEDNMDRAGKGGGLLSRLFGKK